MEQVSNTEGEIHAMRKDNKLQTERADEAEATLVQLYECLELVVRQTVSSVRTKLLSLSTIVTSNKFHI